MNTAIGMLASVHLRERCYVRVSPSPPNSQQGSFLQPWAVSEKAHPGKNDTMKFLHWQCLRGAHGTSSPCSNTNRDLQTLNTSSLLLPLIKNPTAPAKQPLGRKEGTNPTSPSAMSHCRARASPGQGQTSCWVPMRCPSSSTPQDGQTSHASSYPCSRRPCSFSQERWDQQHGSSEGWSQFEGWFCCSFKPGVFI